MTWTIIKRFLHGWTIAGILLVVVSCVKYHDIIEAAIAENILGWFGVLLPVIFVAVVFTFMIRAMFR